MLIYLIRNYSAIDHPDDSGSIFVLILIMRHHQNCDIETLADILEKSQ
jgi:hypothetical protein